MWEQGLEGLEVCVCVCVCAHGATSTHSKVCMSARVDFTEFWHWNYLAVWSFVFGKRLISSAEGRAWSSRRNPSWPKRNWQTTTKLTTWLHNSRNYKAMHSTNPLCGRTFHHVFICALQVSDVPPCDLSQKPLDLNPNTSTLRTRVCLLNAANNSWQKRGNLD